MSSLSSYVTEATMFSLDDGDVIVLTMYPLGSSDVTEATMIALDSSDVTEATMTSLNGVSKSPMITLNGGDDKKKNMCLNKHDKRASCCSVLFTTFFNSTANLAESRKFRYCDRFS